MAQTRLTTDAGFDSQFGCMVVWAHRQRGWTAACRPLVAAAATMGVPRLALDQEAAR